jgi:hypothetical protein
LLPTGPWHLRTIVVVATLCVARAGAHAQSYGGALPKVGEPHEVSQPTQDVAEEGPIQDAAAGALDDFAAEPPLTEELPLPERAATESPPVAPANAADGGQAPAVPPTLVTSAGIGNADVQEMVAARFNDSTIIAVIGANEVQFDLSPRALVALKSAGVSEQVIEAMIAAATAKTRDEPQPARTEVAENQASLEYAKLSEMIERLAAQQEAAAALREPETSKSRTDSSPRVWLVSGDARTPIAPTIAQVAFAGGARRNNQRFKTLQGLAGQALAFASPAVSGIATTLGSLFRPDEERTAVWALAATSSGRVLDVQPAFEIDFAHIPGVDPDRYQPAIVQLVPTKDNYRLVAAAETDGANTGALPSGPIIEESVATENQKLGRGQYRVAPRMMLGPGEYALVLRPIEETKRSRRRSSEETSLGELLGGSTSQILYFTWEFSVAAP